MKNEKLFNAIGNIDEALISEAAKKPPKPWIKWAAAAACLIIAVAIVLPLALPSGETVILPESPGANVDAQPMDGPPAAAADGKTYIISSYLIAHDDLPEGFVYGGTTNAGGYENVPYYVNPDIPEWIYVEQEIRTHGETDEHDTIINIEPRTGYARYVLEDVRGKALASVNDQLYMAMGSVSSSTLGSVMTEEAYDAVLDTYGWRIEGDAPEGFVSLGKAEFSGLDTIPEGRLAVNTGEYMGEREVLFNPEDPNVVLVEAEWSTHNHETGGRDLHEGWNVYVLYDGPR